VWPKFVSLFSGQCSNNPSQTKTVFHVHKQFGEAIPDSALLIVVGLVLGYALQQLHVSYELFNLKSSTFL